MQSGHLTENGIGKIVNRIQNVIVQMTLISQKIKAGSRFFMCDLSDGYVKLKNCVLIDEDTLEGKKVSKENYIVEVTKHSVEPPKKNSQIPVIVIEEYKILYTNATGAIGNPVMYEEFLKNGKVNEDADNTIVLKNQKVASKQTTLPVKKEEKQIKIEKKPEIKFEEERKSNNYSRNEENSKPKQQNSKPKQQKIEIKPKTGPILKNQIRKDEPPARVQQHRPQNNHNLIKELFKGIQNWSIMGRVLFVSPLRTIMTKKGTQSTCLEVQIGDKSGTIKCSAFGEAARFFENTFKDDEIVTISGAQVGENTYQNKTQLKINLSQQTKVQLIDDDGLVPYAEDFCVNVLKLSEMPFGSEANVICLVKDGAEAIDFVSKAGKPLRKRPIMLCDPQNKVQVQVLLWGQKCDNHFQKFPLMIRGVQVSEYNGQKQFKFSLNSVHRVLKQHSLRKFIKDLDNIEMSNVASGKKAPQKTKINNLGELANVMDEINEAGIWSEAIVYLQGIRLNSKNYYMSCPACKKKVMTQSQSVCEKCGKGYESAIYRYILSTHLVDSFGEIWATCYDQVAEVLMGSQGGRFSAYEFSKLTDQGIKQKVGHIKHKQFKVLLTTKQEEYNGQTTKKTSIIKLLPINYKQEIATRLQQLTLL